MKNRNFFTTTALATSIWILPLSLPVQAEQEDILSHIAILLDKQNVDSILEWLSYSTEQQISIKKRIPSNANRIEVTKIRDEKILISFEFPNNREDRISQTWFFIIDDIKKQK